MTDCAAWSGGYVVEIDYVRNAYNDMTPLMLDWTLSTHGVEPPRRSGQPFTYLELGCGHAMTLLGSAAIHPEGEFYGCDINANHIASARAIAQRAELGNLHLFDDSFAELALRDLPDFDYIAMHGVYSWVDATTRSQILDILRRKLRNGGAAYISYNCSPGISQMRPVRDLMRLMVAQAGGSFDARIRDAVRQITKLKEANFPYFQANPVAAVLVDKLASSDSRYIAHEYLNDAWSSFSHSEIVKDMADVKLSFVAQGALPDQFEAFQAPPEWLPLLNQTEDPVMRELLADLVMSRGFRRDVFVRGRAQRLGGGAGERLAWRFALVRVRDACTLPPTLRSQASPQQISAMTPILDHLTKGPAGGKELIALPGVEIPGVPPMAILNSVLALEFVRPALPEASMAACRARTARFNRALMELNCERFEGFGAVVSPVTGQFHSVELLDQLYLLAEFERSSDVVASVGAWFDERGARPILEGKTVEKADTPSRIAAHWGEFRSKRKPLLEQLGVTVID